MNAMVGAQMFKGFGVGRNGVVRLTHLQFTDDHEYLASVPNSIEVINKFVSTRTVFNFYLAISSLKRMCKIYFVALGS